MGRHHLSDQLAGILLYCVIVATHDMDVLPKMDKVCRIQDGRLFEV